MSGPAYKFKSMAQAALRQRAITAMLCLLAACPNGFAAAPALLASALEARPVIDGDVLGDPAWQPLPSATGFTQTRPYEGRPASQRTQVWVGFTEDALYIAAVCYDSEPDAIIVADSRRDSDLAETDSFQFLLDTYKTAKTGSFLAPTRRAWNTMAKSPRKALDAALAREASGVSTSIGTPAGPWPAKSATTAGARSF